MRKSEYLYSLIAVTVLTLSLALVSLPGLAEAYSFVFELRISPDEIRIEGMKEGSRISLPGALPSGEPGYPQILEKNYLWVIPQHKIVEDVRLIETEWKTIAEDVRIVPAQPYCGRRDYCGA